MSEVLTRADQIFESFCKFHRANPHVWRLFEQFTLQVIKAGKASYSAYAIYNRMRWHADFESTGLQVKLSNNHQPYYARLFHVAHPEHAGFFVIRELFSKDRPAGSDPDAFPVDRSPKDESRLTDRLRSLLQEGRNEGEVV